MRNKLTRTLAFAIGLGALAGPASADTTFAPGSLIIPSTATYQTDCGAVSMYGFVYDVLRANAWLETNRATACPAFPGSVTCTIEVYYAYNETKASPNRCTPTDKHLGPAYTGSGTITHDHPKWNDGCDFSVGYDNLPAIPPVMLVNNVNATSTASDGTLSTISTTSKTTGNAVYPNWGSTSITHSATEANDIDVIRYWGGSFIVDDADAITLRKLMQGSLTAYDSSGSAIDFTPFRNRSCSWGTTVGGTVNLHSAQVEFTAPTPRIFSDPPPRLALLARNAGQSPAAGGSSTNPGAALTGRVDDGILQDYLERAGLTFTGAQGCPPGAYWAGDTSICPAGGTPGQIYDLFDFRDLVNNKLLEVSGGERVYKMLWAPHWEFKNPALNTTGPPNASETSVMTAISSFLDQQGGLMGECASIETFEGQYASSSNSSQAVSAGQFQSCKDNGSSACDTASVLYGFKKNGTSSTPNPNGTLYNCTEPTTVITTGSDCAYYSDPADPFAQTADYRWRTDTGRTPHFLPNTGSLYRPGVLPLISGVTSLNKTLLTDATTARGMIIGEFLSRSYKDNDTSKASILYLGGHDLTQSVAGTKVVLQTLLQLGDPPVVPVTKEVSRSSPIVYTINGTNSIIQGTFEKVTPAPTTLTVTSDADVDAFRFPDVIGHLRAYPLTGVGTTQTDFSALTATFDAATKIPPAVYAGCGGSAFGGSCRTVFTNTVGGLRPARVLLEQANLAAISPLMTTGITLNATSQETLVQRVLAGKEVTPGTFAPELGGVDRSTVAVIPTSLVAGTARPTVIYFGGRDGMLHAVCGDILAGSPCASAADLGKELWAFIPRTQLARLRKNTARVDGSPRVIEAFGDFSGSGVRSFRTILIFQTGTGTPVTSGEEPAVYALDITDPTNPTIVWEYTTQDGVGNSLDLGLGLTASVGKVNTGKLLAFAQTANGGNGGVGSVVTAIDLEAGTKVWDNGYVFANPPRTIAGDAPMPSTAIPGGAVTVDKTGAGTISEVVFGTIYGDLWQLDAATGTSRHSPGPYFRFTQNKKPFGVPPTIFSSGGALYAVAVSGGYADTSATILWSGTQHQAVALALTAPNSLTLPDSYPLTETDMASPYLKWVFDLEAGDRAFSQAIVVGGQLFITADSEDVNQTGYGSTADTGQVYGVDLSSGSQAWTVVVAGGAGSIANDGATLYSASGTAAQQLATPANMTGAEGVNNSSPKVTRKLWLRTL